MPFFTNRGITPLPAAPSSVQGWDTAYKSANITLSGGNLVATGTAGAATDVVRGLVGKTGGKVYWEVEITTNPDPGTATFGICICDSLYIGSGGTVDGTKMAILIFSDNQVYESNSGGAVGSTSNPWTTGKVVGIAADLSTKRMWFTHGETTEWLGASGDPTPSPITPSGGVNIAAIASTAVPPYYPFLDIRASGVVMTGRFLPTYVCPSAADAIGAGFGNWV